MLNSISPIYNYNLYRPSSLSFTAYGKPYSIEKLAISHPNMVEAVFSDVDDTMTYFDKSKGKKILPPRNKTMARMLKQQNIPLILTSGRSITNLKSFVANNNLHNTYIISESGARITNPQGKEIYHQPISANDAKELLDYCRNILIKKNFPKTHIQARYAGREYIEENKNPYDKELNILYKPFEKEFGENFKPSCILIVDRSGGNADKIAAQLNKDFKGRFNIHSTSPYACEIYHKDVSKGHAIDILCKKLNVNLRNTVAIGDGNNDAQMLEKVKNAHGAAIMMGNAVPKLKSYTNYKTLNVRQSGFAIAMQAIITNNSRHSAQIQ